MTTRLQIALLGSVAVTLACALFFLNWKGVNLHFRDLIWKQLFIETWNNSRWLGYGINYTKELTPTLDLPFQTAHNFLLEIFISSGLVGLAVILYLSLRLLKHYRFFQFDSSTLFYSGIFGLLAFLVMGQFDLKFASYRFFGSHCFFLGLIYAHRRVATDEIAHNRDDRHP